jgi:hypothetical protein
MLIRKPADLRYSDVTPKQLYVNRRASWQAPSRLARWREPLAPA